MDLEKEMVIEHVKGCASRHAGNRERDDVPDGGNGRAGVRKDAGASVW